MTQKTHNVNKKGIIGVQGFILIVIILILIMAAYTYYLEFNGSNNDKVEFCKGLGLEVKNEISFILDMTCVKDDEKTKERIVYTVKKDGGKFYLDKSI